MWLARQRRHVYSRLTRTRTTTCFLLLALLHLLVQCSIHASAFHFTSMASTKVKNVLVRSGVKPAFAIVLNGGSRNEVLKICRGFNEADDPAPCVAVYPQGRTANESDATLSAERVTGRPVNETVLANGKVQRRELSPQCIDTLFYPEQVLRDQKREEMTFICYHLWLFGMIVLALMDESIPHIIASIFTHLLASSYLGYQIFRTMSFRNDYWRIVVRHSCEDADLLIDHFQIRLYHEVPAFIVSAVTFALSLYFSIRQTRIYLHQVTQRVGATVEIHKMHRLLLSHFTLLQVTFFFLVAAGLLWLDQLVDGPIAPFSNYQGPYIAGAAVTFVMQIAWTVLGSYGFHKEKKWASGLYIFITFCFVTSACGLFFSSVYMWTYTSWRFFAIIHGVTLVLIVAVIPLDIICWRNFDKGLAHYLRVQDILEEEDFTPAVMPHDPERSDFTHRHSETESVSSGLRLVASNSGLMHEPITKHVSLGRL